MLLTALYFVGFLASTRADFACICGNGGNVKVHPSKSQSSSPIGTIQNGECKAISTEEAIDAHWLAVDYHHTVGYVERTGSIALSRCHGDPSSLDALTTAGSGVTTASTSEGYPCICGYGGLVVVYPQKSTSTQPIGGIPDGQCKPISDKVAIDNHWLAVDYYHQIGYVERTATLSLSKCPGHPSSMDLVTTPSSSGSQTTALPQWTTRPSNTAVSGHTELCPQHLQYYTHTDHAKLTQHGSSCYEIVPSLVSWSHAENNCHQKGGHLVSITSAEEQEFLYLYLDQNYNHTMWIGLHDRQHEEHFVWTSGEHVSYTNWAPGRKTAYHNYEDCAYMIPTQVLRGSWDDIACGGDNQFTESFGELHRFICEFPISSHNAIVG